MGGTISEFTQEGILIIWGVFWNWQIAHLCIGSVLSQPGPGREKSRTVVRDAFTRESPGASAPVIPTDVTDPQACSAMIQQAVSRFSRIDTLIHNAGMSMESTGEDVQNVNFFQQVMTVKFFQQRVL